MGRGIGKQGAEWGGGGNEEDSGHRVGAHEMMSPQARPADGFVSLGGGGSPALWASLNSHR